MSNDPTSRAGLPILTSVAIVAILVVVSILLFVTVYLVFPEHDHFTALLLIGILALAFALVAYLLQATSASPIGPRALAWGYLGMGFATLFITLAAAPDPDVGSVPRLIGLLVVVLLLAIALAFIGWRSRSVAAERHRSAAREEWTQHPPPSAFTYATAQAAPTVVPPGASEGSAPNGSGRPGGP
jgi:hypothetical protein